MICYHHQPNCARELVCTARGARNIIVTVAIMWNGFSLAWNRKKSRIDIIFSFAFPFCPKRNPISSNVTLVGKVLCAICEDRNFLVWWHEQQQNNNDALKFDNNFMTLLETPGNLFTKWSNGDYRAYSFAMAEFRSSQNDNNTTLDDSANEKWNFICLHTNTRAHACTQ